MKIGKVDMNLGFFIPAGFKILDCEVHPVNTWVGVIEEDRSAYLWDYSLKSVLRVLSSKELDEKEPGGLLKAFKFLDPHVLRWKWLRSQDLNEEAFQGKGKQKYWMIIVMEYKIVFIDYRTGEKKTLHYSKFENKCICCIEFVDSSYLAVGFSDGSIRIFDIEDWEVVKVFPRGTHLRQITHLVSFSKNLSQRSLLISAGADGVIAVWNVDTCTDIPAFLLSSNSATAHSGLINKISFSNDLSQLCVIGADKVISVWNILNSTLIHKYKNLKDSQKKKIIGGCYFNHPGLSKTTVLVHSSQSQVLYFDTLMHTYPKDHQNLQVLTDLNASRILGIKVHPLQPYLIFIVSEEGIYLIYYERTLNLPFAFSQFFSTQIKISSCMDENHFLYYYHQDCLYSLVFGVAGSVQAQSFQLVSRPIGAKVQIKVSSTGNYISILSGTTGLYDIYSIDANPTKAPDRIKSGYSTHLVWDPVNDRFACICPLNEDDTTGSFASVVSKILLVVYEINYGKVCMIYRGDGMPTPSALFGGTVLAISSQSDGATIFYSWENLKPLSGSIPKPIDIYWSENSCIISYKTEFYVYIYKKTLNFMYKVTESIRTGVWSYSVFFYSTDKDIYWLMPCLKNPYLLASHSIANISENEFNIKEDKVSEKIVRKPQEYCSLVGVFQGHLMVVTSGFKMLGIPIRSIFLRFCMLVGSGIVTEAMPLTQKMQENLHKLAAKVLEFMGHPQAALDLTGLSYYKTVKIAARNNFSVPIVTPN